MRRALLSVLLVASLSCAPTWADAVTAAGQVGREVACVVCSAGVPKTPPVDANKPSAEDAAKLLAWSAAMIAVLQDVVQRGAAAPLLPAKKAAP